MTMDPALAAALRALRLLRGRGSAVYLLYSGEERCAWVGAAERRLVLSGGALSLSGARLPGAANLTDFFGSLRSQQPPGFFLIGPPREREGGAQPSAVLLEPALEYRIEGSSLRVSSGEPDVALERALEEGAEPVHARPDLPLPASNAMLGWAGESDTSYCDRLRSAIELTRGRGGKIIVTRRYTRPVPADADMLALLAELAALEPDAAAIHFVELPGAWTSLGTSPENVIECRAGRLLVDAVAGTRARHVDPDLDAALRRELLSSPKELKEHAMAVERAQQFAAGLCQPGSVELAFARSLRRLRAVQHLHSRVEGTLVDGVEFTSLLERCHPPLSSYPADLAERVPPPWPGRFYGGMVGRIEGERAGASFLNLRCLEREADELRTYAGVGCVDGSTVEGELDEVLNKLSTVRDAVSEWLIRAAG